MYEIPKHLRNSPGYAEHLAWRGYDVDAEPKRLTMTGADLTGADLTDADLTGADLHGADLRWVNLGNADLTDADLRWVNLGDADLTGVNLTGVNLTGADLDFSALPLWCGGLRFRDDTHEIMRQIEYHNCSLKLYNGIHCPQEALDFANEWSGRQRHDLPELQNE